MGDILAAATTTFFDTLRKRKWALYIPERVHRAHMDNLLHGWGMRDSGPGDERRYNGVWQVGSNFYLIESLNCSDLRIPLLIPKEGLRESDRQIVQRFRNYITMYDKDWNCPRLPDSPSLFPYDDLWDSMRERFGLTKAQVRRIVSWNDWVYSLRFFPIWVNTGEKYIGPWELSHIPPAERKEWERKAQEIRTKRRVLKKDYGLTSEYTARHKATLILLGEAFSPEQVRKMRRQLEDKIRKDPAEVVRLRDRIPR